MTSVKVVIFFLFLSFLLIEISAQSTTASSSQSSTDSTTQSTTVSTTQSSTDSTTQSTTVSTTQSSTDSTIQSTTVSTSQPSNVSTVCNANQTYDPHAANPLCRPSCQNPEGYIISFPSCVCLPMYVLNNANSSQCILQSECPKFGIYPAYRLWQQISLCGINELYDAIAPHPDCRSSCENRQRLLICRKPGLYPGCICKKPYIRYRITNQCILPINCPNIYLLYNNRYRNNFNNNYYYYNRFGR
ncbi:uncharacterized protein LOC127283379 isoform X2 [Leptopilina boulardi]|uniref:uncharacterized protein LOC127283379 isoform X2 n=1 Tax=Leptopilina boulardi TaxID=63433 RepID=UPI0021F60EBA|nr:uncharacterized protein LOC127283379 isoform X2 [Leptopilina boulardi]